LFWNPLFWLIRNRVHSYAELSCDAWALWAYPEERRAYAEALVDSHEQNRTAALAVRGLCATHPNVKDLERRLTLIMKQKVTRGNSRLILTAAAALAITIAPGLS
jgi:beta-lactamase regulating signal transducer with metallopeptidase domain